MLGLELTTPAVLRILEVLTVSAVVVFLVVTTFAFAGARSAFADARDRTSEGVSAALDVQFALSEMDANAASMLLVADRTDLDVTRAGALDGYRQRWTTAYDGVVATTRRLDPGEDSAQVQVLVSKMPEYQSHVDLALFLQSRNEKAAALQEYQRATDLMRGTLLEAAKSLTDVNTRKLDSISSRQQAEVHAVATVVTVVVVICFVMLLASQLFLFRRTRRTLNFGLIAATVLLAGGIGMAGAGLSNASTNLKVAKSDAFDSKVELSRARAEVSRAHADELRWLFDHDRARTYEDDFLATSTGLLQKGTTGSAANAQIYYDGTAKPAADSAKVTPNRFPNYSGRLITAYKSVSFPGEDRKVQVIFEKYAAFQLTNARVLTNYNADPTKLPPNALSGGEFRELDNAIGDAVKINDDAFDQALDNGSNTALLWLVLLPLVSLLCIVFIVLGFRPRIAEYQRS